MHLNMVDYILLAVVVLSLLLGLMRGFVREIIAIIAWVIAVMLMMFMAPLWAHYFSGISANHTVQLYCTYGAILIVVWIVGAIVGKIISRMVDYSSLMLVNHFLGGVFGAVRGVVICVFLALVVVLTSFANNPLWVQSTFAKPLSKVAMLFHKRTEAFLQEKKQQVQQHAQNISDGYAGQAN